MPRIFDNIELRLVDELTQTIGAGYRADFCVGYFNVRGWKLIDRQIEAWPGGEGNCCRVLVGMQPRPQEELAQYVGVPGSTQVVDLKTASELKQRVAQEFRDQLVRGVPTNADEKGLRRLSKQLRAGQVVIKVFVREPLHAKLYLVHRQDPTYPAIAYVGSSNLTFPGLRQQGELNVDVTDSDAVAKLQRWFDDRWADPWTADISEELADIIDESWARPEPLPPYHVYLKMAYHLAEEARSGLAEFGLPRDMQGELLEFQSAAVKIAAHHINKRGGVIIGDVVGLGKTLMAVALARLLQEDQFTDTLIICPPKLVPMWEDYRDRYRLMAKIVSLGAVTRELPDLRRYRVVLIDESHNLRNREGQRYRAIRDYIEKNDCRCILLSATPYNKSYLDLSAQLRLFVDEQADLGLRPEQLLRQIGETEFTRRHQAPIRSLAAFEKSPFPDDWRELMRLYLVRRTRSFIEENYAVLDPNVGRRFLEFPTGDRFYFPKRQPRTAAFEINEDDPNDQYARLYTTPVVDAINGLLLPRYGLANYLAPGQGDLTPAERDVVDRLSRAGSRLMGFCRTNLFKRLESGGPAFLQSIERHVLRNAVVLHALDNGLPVPIGTQDVAYLESENFDEDTESVLISEEGDTVEESDADRAIAVADADFAHRAAGLYHTYETTLRRRFRWLRSSLFQPELANDLRADIESLIGVLSLAGQWNPREDRKLARLRELIELDHANEKVLVFTQFADTAEYLADALSSGLDGGPALDGVESVSGRSSDPTKLAWRFSPRSNLKSDTIPPSDELRVLIATDVLSEGQNLQDCAVVVNYDIPWAIIRLIQRAGRVDRIGQRSPNIDCYSFLPADGVEQIIRLRQRVRQRLKENAEVIGTDEAFFEDEQSDGLLHDIYSEQAGALDDEIDNEVDLASLAYQIWKNAIDEDPSLEATIPALANVVYSARAHQPSPDAPAGVLVYMRTAGGNDSLAWIDSEGRSVTESQLAILTAAACGSEEQALERSDDHHQLVATAAEMITAEESVVGGQLGRPNGARFRTYERMTRHAESVKGTLFETHDLLRTIDDIYRYPLLQAATDTINRQLRSGIDDAHLAELVITLRNEGRLSIVEGDEQEREPQIVCSLGLIGKSS